MKNTNPVAEKLKRRALDLKRRTEETYRSRGIEPHPRDVPGLLEVIAEDVTKETISRKRLEGHAFGIWRIVTDWILSDTDVAQELLEFRLELRKFASMLEKDE